MSSNETALVLFSGGQDSTTCLAWALDRFAKVETIGFAYGQRHLIELDCRDRLLSGIRSIRPDWAAKLGDSHTVDIPTLAEISDTALTRDVAIEMGKDGLPNTFVPGRNLVFLTFAAALAYRRGIRHIVGGMCETDYSGYPDCRDDTIKALNAALNGMLGLVTRAACASNRFERARLKSARKPLLMMSSWLRSLLRSRLPLRLPT